MLLCFTISIQSLLSIIYIQTSFHAGFQYAKSLMSFTENCDEFATEMVDNLLDILTKGEHSKVIKQDGVYTTKDEALKPPPAAEPEIVKDPVQEKLDHTACLINDLQQTQSDRLSGRLPSHLSQVSIFTPADRFSSFQNNEWKSSLKLLSVVRVRIHSFHLYQVTIKLCQ